MASQQIRNQYRILAQLVKRQPQSSQDNAWKELRTSFRRPLAAEETVESRLSEADKRISFLRIITPKDRPMNQSGRWVYKDGKHVEGQTGTKRDSAGRVVSNWDGRNLDPESVKRHNQQLNRAGFVNNSHAKGIF